MVILVNGMAIAAMACMVLALFSVAEAVWATMRRHAEPRGSELRTRYFDRATVLRWRAAALGVTSLAVLAMSLCLDLARRMW